jgi:hypothetical protein
MRRKAADVIALEQTCLRGDKPRDRAQQGRLAGAVRPEDVTSSPSATRIIGFSAATWP